MPLGGLLLSIGIGVSLGFFGGGGSILTVPLLVYGFGLDPKEAIASSLLIVGIASLSGAFAHWRRGNVRPKEGLAFGVAGMIGAFLGGRASAFIDGGVLLILFASMMLLTAVAMWRGRRGDPSAAPPRPAYLKLAAQGIAVGSFTGLVGAGGGFLIVPALALWAGLPMAAAVGTSLLVIVLNCTAGFLGTLSHVHVDLTLVAAVTTAAVAGSFAGTRLAQVVDPASLRRAFAGFVLVMGSLILVREGALVANAAAEALPANLPQLVFAIAMLCIGVLAGRATRNANDPLIDRAFDQGSGI
jgi:uncharacterized membrane protein YfcA